MLTILVSFPNLVPTMLEAKLILTKEELRKTFSEKSIIR